MPARLDDVEARILGALVEKSLTTPEQYPLSYNALIGACNQKTSRDPVMELDEAAVGRGLHALIEKGLAERRSVPGSRVPKFVHHIEKLLGGGDEKEIGAVCVLLLRGPQTPGEIKTRTDRLCAFSDTADVEGLLQGLCARGEPIAARLPRQPGQKESRYRQLFTGEAPAPAAEPAAARAPASSDRFALLEKRVEALEAFCRTLAGRPGKPPSS